MTQSKQNFEVRTGEHKVLRFTVLNADGTAKDITGATVYWAATNPNGTSAAIEQVSGGSEVDLTDAATGIFLVNLVPADTVSMSPGSYRHSAQITLSGVESVVSEGWMRVRYDYAGTQ